MIFMPLSQFVAVWLIRKVHSVVLQSGNCTEHPVNCEEEDFDHVIEHGWVWSGIICDHTPQNQIPTYRALISRKKDW